ncbi:glycoside hydrolase family 38 C-terminal domain-containing protein [Aliivibrio fischeri]|uniref:glycoside hydrolase family 38 N-terminal domain-containing protein n=1 Tax=Aliivibrio fischeri TaxID=668 RepID=UPI00080DF12E|nr:glycoside hydrolase family 38 C-terminal domain-containing protein [Aliivibrio fischeri]OCH11083.1 sugar hydrolase [Aliivibrio fischeri]
MSINKKAYIVPHTHWDREWYFSTEESQVLLVFTMKQMLDELELDDNLPCFVLDGQSVMLEDYLSVMPDETSRVKRLIESGRLLVGPWYTQTDQCVVHGESQIRNLLWGCRDAERFGHVMKIGYVPDSFGQSEQLPQLLQHFTIDKCVFWRGIWEGICPNTEFVWRAPNGSKVTTAVLEFGYSAFQGMKPMDDHLDAIDQKMSQRFWPSNREHFLFMGGHDQKPWQSETAAAVDAANTVRPHQYQLGTFEDYFSVTCSGDLEEVQSEMLYGKYSRIHRGIYSTRYDIKKLNSDVENLLINQLEPLLTVANSFGLRYPYGLMEKNWKQLMQSHAHDSIGGCNTDSVNAQVKARITSVKENAERLKDITLKQLADASTKSLDDEFVLVFNPLPYTRDAYVEVELVLPTRAFTLNDNGELIPIEYITCEEVDINAIVQDPTTLGDERFRTWYRHRVVTNVKQLPACGYRNLRVEKLKDSTFVSTVATCPESNDAVIENRKLKVSVDQKGRVALTHISSGQHWENALLLVDGGDDGDNYDFSAPYQDHLVTFEAKPDGVSVERGELHTAIHILYTAVLPKNLDERADKVCSTVQGLELTLMLMKDSDQLEISASIDNQVEEHRLQLHINGGFMKAESIADQPIGLIRRGDDAEALSVWKEQNWTSAPVPIYPMQSVVSGETKIGGLAVMTDGIREYQQYPESIAITLFRSVGYVGKPDLQYRPGRLSGLPDASPDSQLKGIMTFKLALYPFDGNAFEAGLCQRVKTWLTQPIMLYNGVVQRFMIAPPQIDAPNAFSLFDYQHPTLTVSAIKVCEDDDKAIIVRYFNDSNKHTTLGQLPSGWQIDIADGMERAIESASENTEVAPQGMMALRLERQL